MQDEEARHLDVSSAALQSSRRNEQPFHVAAETTTNGDAPPETLTKIELPFMPRNQLAAVRLAMGLLLTFLVIAALATVVAVKQYRLVVATFWAMLIVAFCALGQLLQYALARDEDIVPPVVRRMVEAVATEMDNFRQDWREQVLLLKNEPEENGYASATEWGL